MSKVDAIQIVIITSFVALCLRLACGPGAWRRLVEFWLDVPRRRPLRDCMIVFFAVLGIDALETKNDDRITKALGYDLSGFVNSLEGDAVAVIQRFLGWPWLTPLLAFAYVVGFIGLLVGLAHAYDRRGDQRRLVLVTYSYAVNFLAVLPFYLFFPVKEPWAHPGSNVLPLTDLHLGPWVMELIRPMSGIDNCFPSYHVSLTTSLVLVARDGKNDALSRFATIVGTLVIASTVILGFHWVIDAVLGYAFGFVVFRLGQRFAARFPAAPDSPCVVPPLQRAGIDG